MATDSQFTAPVPLLADFPIKLTCIVATGFPTLAKLGIKFIQATSTSASPAHRIFIRVKKVGDRRVTTSQMGFDLKDAEAFLLQFLHSIVAGFSLAMKALPSLFLGAVPHIFAGCRRNNGR